MEITEENIMVIFPIVLCVVAVVVWFCVVGVNIFAYLFRNQCQNCIKCKNGEICGVTDTPITNCNLEGKCGFFKKK